MRSLQASEQQIQAAIVQWLRTAIDCRVAHIPNGGSRDKREAARLKWQGVEAGAPDLFVIWSDGPEPRVLFIECKTEKGRLSDEQKAWREDATRYGHDYLVARSLDDVRAYFTGESP
jgi:hypothetical protein